MGIGQQPSHTTIRTSRFLFRNSHARKIMFVMTVAALVAAVATHLALPLSKPLRMPAIRMDAAAAERRPVSAVVTELDSVPVFAIAINGDKLYSTDETGCMIYTHLSDASRVLAQLQSTYPAEALALEALSLGTVLSESGLLIKREAPPRITLVASPDAKRAARDLRAKGPAASSSDPPIVSSAVPKRWRPLTEIPVFHIGTLARRPSMAFEVDEAAEGLLWPLFFRLSDIDRLWEELGDSSTERPPVRAIDLATLVVCLREPAGAPGQPLVCAPLDALDFVAEKNRQALADAALQRAGGGDAQGEGAS
jgi:hypothetical protein